MGDNIVYGAGGIPMVKQPKEVAPVEKSAAYMSIHMALTGFRGTLAPFIGYWILSQFHVQAVALTGGLLIILACIAFECMRQHPRNLSQH